MKASALEFRWRYPVHVVIYALGFAAPWDYLINRDASSTVFWSSKALWLPAALEIERAGWLSLTGASNLLLGLGIFFALAGAALRTWGAAYLGAGVVNDPGMHGTAIIAGGPYRHMRNPLYVGTVLHTFALALLMPASGAVFTIVFITVEQLRLIGGEEAFLDERLGQSYLDYKHKVPSVVPSLRARMPASNARPAWGLAVIGEAYFWGVAASFCSVGMRYNALLVTQGVVIALGVSLVMRAFVPKVAATA